MVKADQSSWNLQDITPDVEFPKIKKKIEGKNIRVTEGLTKKSMESLKKAKEDHGFEKVGSSEAKIFYKDVNDRNKTNIYFD